MVFNSFIFKYDNNNIIFNNCEINEVYDNYTTYDYLKKLNPIYNINVKLIIENNDCLNELNKMVKYFNTNSLDNKLSIFNKDILILCENLIISNFKFNIVDKLYYQYKTVILNIISHDITIFNQPKLYHRKMKMDKILDKINKQKKNDFYY